MIKPNDIIKLAEEFNLLKKNSIPVDTASISLLEQEDYTSLACN